MGAHRLAQFLKQIFLVNADVCDKLCAEVSTKCQVCLLGKPNRQRDRGGVGCLPVPHAVNQEVAIDIIYLEAPIGEGNVRGDHALFMMDTLSRFSQVIVLKTGPTKKRLLISFGKIGSANLVHLDV